MQNPARNRERRRTVNRAGCQVACAFDRGSDRAADARSRRLCLERKRCIFQIVQYWESITGPGTIDELVADAHAAGHADFNARLARAWIAKGILGSPQVRTLHRGSDKALHSAHQRKLLLIVLDKRRRSPELKLNSLAQIPLAVWLWWGEDYVAVQQAQRAFSTWLGRGQRNKDVARDGAVGLLRQIDHPLATPTARTRLVRLVTDLGNGQALTKRGRAELVDAVREVMEPDSVFAASGMVRAVGPVGAPMTCEHVVAHVEIISLAVQHILSTGVSEQLLEEARAAARAWTADYLAERPGLEAAAGSLADAFRSPTLDEQVNTAGKQLLHTLGLLLRQRQQ